MNDGASSDVVALTEIFYSVQGEGAHAGTAAVFVRLSGCNLNCGFCDTDFAVREMRSCAEILARVDALAPPGAIVILTGGEPLAQTATPALIAALRAAGRRVHIESNGTMPTDLPADVWLTVSPKERLHPVMAARADEIKCIVDGRVPLEQLDAFDLIAKPRPVFLQPENNKPANVALAIDAIKARPGLLRLSLQTHKFIGIA